MIPAEGQVRRALVVIAVLSLASLSPVSGHPQASGGQERLRTDHPASDPLPVQRRFRPKLSLQNALKIAEKYVDDEHVDMSSYWLYRAKFIMMGDQNTAEKNKLPCWHFWWVNDTGTLGDYVEILVTMDGKASRAPSM
jgi:hypothetical protein